MGEEKKKENGRSKNHGTKKKGDKSFSEEKRVNHQRKNPQGGTALAEEEGNVAINSK